MNPRAVSGMTLRRAEDGDPSLSRLKLSTSVPFDHGQFWPADSDDLLRLGEAIAYSKHIQFLCVTVAPELAYEFVNNKAFFEVIKQNMSIKKLAFENCNFSNPVVCDIFTDFAANISNLQGMLLVRCDLGGHLGISAVTPCFARSKNLMRITITYCNAADDVCAKFVSGIKGMHPKLGLLNLSCNSIGKKGCEAVSALLQDPNCNLTYVDLGSNEIDGTCAKILSDSLKYNNKLTSLQLYRNGMIRERGWEAFSKAICDTTTVYHTFHSNHTLCDLGVRDLPNNLPLVLSMNRIGSNYCGGGERRVAMEKILHHHVVLDMRPFLEWELKVLPIAITWFDKATTCRNADLARINTNKLSAIYQFARTLPLMFLPSSQKGNDHEG